MAAEFVLCESNPTRPNLNFYLPGQSDYKVSHVGGRSVFATLPIDL